MIRIYIKNWVFMKKFNWVSNISLFYKNKGFNDGEYGVQNLKCDFCLSTKNDWRWNFYDNF